MNATNVDAVDSLATCFDKPYVIAYACTTAP
jgi:hypothetical protein